MALARVRKFTNINEMEFFLRGGILGSAKQAPSNGTKGRAPGGGFTGLVGLTLTFTTPSVAITFAAATLGAGEVRDPNILLIKDIQAQVSAASTTALTVVGINGALGFIETAPTTGLVIAADDEPARGVLGLPNNVAVASFVYNPPGGAAPAFAAYNCLENTHVLFTWE